MSREMEVKDAINARIKDAPPSVYKRLSKAPLAITIGTAFKSLDRIVESLMDVEPGRKMFLHVLNFAFKDQAISAEDAFEAYERKGDVSYNQGLFTPLYKGTDTDPLSTVAKRLFQAMNQPTPELNLDKGLYDCVLGRLRRSRGLYVPSIERTLDSSLVRELFGRGEEGPLESLEGKFNRVIFQQGDSPLVMPWDPLLSKRKPNLHGVNPISDAMRRVYREDLEDLRTALESPQRALDEWIRLVQATCYDLFSHLRTDKEPFSELEETLFKNYVSREGAYILKLDRNLPRKVAKRLVLRLMSVLDIQRPNWYTAESCDQGISTFTLDVLEADAKWGKVRLYVYPPEAFTNINRKVLLSKDTIQVQQEERSIRIEPEGISRIVLEAAQNPLPQEFQALSQVTRDLLGDAYSIRMAQRRKQGIYQGFDFGSILRDHRLQFEVMKAAQSAGKEGIQEWEHFKEWLLGERIEEVEVLSEVLKLSQKSGDGEVYRLKMRLPQAGDKPGRDQEFALKRITKDSKILALVKQYAFASLVAPEETGIRLEGHSIREVSPEHFIFSMPFHGPYTGEGLVHRLMHLTEGISSTQKGYQKKGVQAAAALAGRSPQDLSVLDAIAYRTEDRNRYACVIKDSLNALLGPLPAYFEEVVARALHQNDRVPNYADFDAGIRNQFIFVSSTEDLNLRLKPFGWLGADSAGLIYLPPTIRGVARTIEQARHCANQAQSSWQPPEKDEVENHIRKWFDLLPKRLQGGASRFSEELYKKLRPPVQRSFSSETPPEIVMSLLLSCYLMPHAQALLDGKGRGDNVDLLHHSILWGGEYSRNWQRETQAPDASVFVNGFEKMAEQIHSRTLLYAASSHGSQ